MNITSIPIELTTANVRFVDYKVLLDLDNDGTYETDISNDTQSIDYTLSDLSAKIGQGEILGKPSINTASITLLNSQGKFSPNNASNCGARINTKINILAGFIDDTNISKTRVLFSGVITAFNASYSNNSKTMVLTLKDLGKIAQKKKNPNHSYTNGRYYEASITNVTLSDAVNFLISYCYGTSFPREIQTLTTIYPIIEFPIDQYVWDTLQTLAQACDAHMFFENGIFKFYTPLSLEFTNPSTSQFTFTAANLYDFNESVDENNIYNKFKITSNPKTMQGRQIIVGSPNFSEITAIETYQFDDGKDALGDDNKTITLKSQLDDGEGTWTDTINVPLKDGLTFSDLGSSSTQADINNMNYTSLIKLWDMTTGNQLTIQDADIFAGKIVAKDTINRTNYNLQITYQYLPNIIMPGKYKWFEFALDKVSGNIEQPSIEAGNSFDNINLVISDWQILDGHKRLKFKLINNEPYWTTPIPVLSRNLCSGGTVLSSGETILFYYEPESNAGDTGGGSNDTGATGGDYGGAQGPGESSPGGDGAQGPGDSGDSGGAQGPG